MKNEFKFTIQQNVKFSKWALNEIPSMNRVRNAEDFDPTPDTIGGIIWNGTLCWMANGSHIEIISLKTGNKVASYTFNNSLFPNALITCLTEIEIPDVNSCILAIGAQCSTMGSLLIIFATHGSRVLRCIELVDKITSCTFIPASACRQNHLILFDGCIAIGSHLGKVTFLDLNLKECTEILFGKKIIPNKPQVHRSHIVLSNVEFEEILKYHTQSKFEHVSLGIQMEVLDNSGPVLSILSSSALSVLAIGLGDGQMILYDLRQLNAFHIAHPPERDMPLIKLAYIEPADDPRACAYIWAFHANSDTAVAVMHSIMFERKRFKNGDYVYENFQSCSPRLTLPTFEQSVIPVSCQSMAKTLTYEEEVLSLCLLSWSSPNCTYVCLFDLNQWYKEQMPNFCDWREYPTYLACFPFDETMAIDVWINRNSVVPFSSIQRPEEHFYPSSLTFDCILITQTCTTKLHWPGLQNQTLEFFSRSGPNSILDPSQCFEEMIKASLVPQFHDSSNHSTKSKQNFLLSIALEYNCVGLLKKCAKAWADGSHMGRQPFEGLSLSTITDWLWDRATIIKDRCNSLCACLFDHSGMTIDYRSRKNLWRCSRQLKTLADLLSWIIENCQQYIPGKVFDTLQSQRNSIQMASAYQEVLQWLLNMGLLPEGIWNNDLSHTDDDDIIGNVNVVPYPYPVLRNYYMARRRKFCELNRQLINTKTKSCRILFIDAMIENECNASFLRTEWKKGSESGDGLYPPPSLQCLLRTLLVPDVSIEKKYMLFIYMFLDLNMALNDERYSSVVENLIKFPAVFMLKPALIKTTQAFWHLDHGEFETAIEELISPFSANRHITPWQQELLIEVLLLQDRSHLALRALRAPRPSISPMLEIRTLLANDLIAEAFELQRSKDGLELLDAFFKHCYDHNKWSQVFELALTKDEEQRLGEFLRQNNSMLSDNLYVVYLLQRGKYMDALAFMDDLQSKKNERRLDLDTPNTILDSYKMTMAPMTRQLSDLFYTTKEMVNLKLNKQQSLPCPLSSKLWQKNFGVVGGVYHQALLSTAQLDSQSWQNNKKKHWSLVPSDIPFLRNPQYDFDSLHPQLKTKISHPEPYVPNKKRVFEIDNDDEILDEEFSGGSKKRQRLGSISKRTPKMNMSLLTSFKDRHLLTLQNKTQTPKPIEECQSKAALFEDTLLSTPLVKSLRTEQSVLLHESDRVSTPHSILKIRSTRESSISSGVRGVSMEPDEKLIRFNLPESNEISYAEPHLIQISTAVDLQLNKTDNLFGLEGTRSVSDDERSDHFESNIEKNDEISEPHSMIVDENIYQSPKPRKRLRSITSEDQESNSKHTSPHQRTISKSESPEKSSDGNDIINISTRSQSEDRDILVKSDKYSKFPLARRSYRTISISTPELQKKHSFSASTPKSKTNLVRMVLESNAKKIINQKVNDGEESDVDESNTVETSDSYLKTFQRQRIFTDSTENDLSKSLAIDQTASVMTDDSFIKMVVNKPNILNDSSEQFTTFESSEGDSKPSEVVAVNQASKEEVLVEKNIENEDEVNEENTEENSDGDIIELDTEDEKNDIYDENVDEDVDSGDEDEDGNDVEFSSDSDWQVESKSLNEKHALSLEQEEEEEEDDEDDVSEKSNDFNDSFSNTSESNSDKQSENASDVESAKDSEEFEERSVSADNDEFGSNEYLGNEEISINSSAETNEISGKNLSNEVIDLLSDESNHQVDKQKESDEVESEQINTAEITDENKNEEVIEFEYNDKPSQDDDEITESLLIEEESQDPKDKVDNKEDNNLWDDAILISQSDEIQSETFAKPHETQEIQLSMENDFLNNACLQEQSDITLTEDGSEFLTASEAENSLYLQEEEELKMDMGFAVDTITEIIPENTANSIVIEQVDQTNQSHMQQEAQMIDDQIENTKIIEDTGEIECVKSPETIESKSVEDQQNRIVDTTGKEETQEIMEGVAIETDLLVKSDYEKRENNETVTFDQSEQTSTMPKNPLTTSSPSFDVAEEIQPSTSGYTKSLKPLRVAKSNSVDICSNNLLSPIKQGRQTRSSSVPKTITVDPPTTPTFRRTRQALLLDESNSPSVTTPRRTSRHASVDREISEVVDSPARNTRARSLSIDTVDMSQKENVPATKVKNRRTSKDDDDALSVTSVKSTRSTRSTRSVTAAKNVSSKADDDDKSSVKSSTSTRSLTKRKKKLDIISEETSSDIPEIDYSSNRRLTRNQIALINKMQKAKKISTTATLSTVSEMGDLEEQEDVDEQSDTQSLISTDSKASKTHQTRSKTVKSVKSDDLSPTKSSTNLEEIPMKRRLRKASNASSK